MDDLLHADVLHVLTHVAALEAGGADALAELAGPGEPTITRDADEFRLTWPSGWYFVAPTAATAVVVGLVRGRRDARRASLN